MTKDKWTRLVEYINKKSIGEIIYRKDIIKLNDEGSFGDTTTDNLRLWLVHCEYLKSTGRGEYKILRHINNKISSSDIKKMAYNYEYRMNHERFEKLSEILNGENKCNNGEFFELTK